MPYKMETALHVVDNIAKSLAPDFMFTSNLKELYTELIRYFHADPKFVGDLNKGLLLMGPTGTGKTLAMQIMRLYRQIDNTKMKHYGKYKSMQFDIVPSDEIVYAYMNHGLEGIEKYRRRIVICIDDIGNEIPQAKNFGNNLDVMGRFLIERYSMKLMTFATTNFSMEQMNERYDDRVVSRMHGLFNFMILNGSDYRRQSDEVRDFIYFNNIQKPNASMNV